MKEATMQWFDRADNQPVLNDGFDELCKFVCGKCGHETDWLQATKEEYENGIPCPKCK